MKELISEQLYERYDRLMQQQSLDKMSNIMYCPRPACGCPVLIDENLGACASCDYAFCVYCKMTYHGVSPCRISAICFSYYV